MQGKMQGRLKRASISHLPKKEVVSRRTALRAAPGTSSNCTWNHIGVLKAFIAASSPIFK
jgi:hypothetical protein